MDKILLTEAVTIQIAIRRLDKNILCEKILFCHQSTSREFSTFTLGPTIDRYRILLLEWAAIITKYFTFFHISI